ncbi:ATP-binding cassette domain-containing protein [Bifidobacterium pullorum subsp. saeculare]|uniref:ATP-binding cassette domain-containing protein n=1 Tax=Bifidobacterium pullorum subsp. saeculare TaxID=78257 RepID=A0A938WYX4_9BIFI|nr:ATP-binding cassette domain-containing protein [Bifidobacterium pullorum]MBM6700421.1 ATP-binding cassette domain-containing protein [Bifidobacterium pullorum subsp. saeculare]
MFDKRLFTIAPGLGWLVAGKVLTQWVGLLANVAFVLGLVGLLSPILAAADSIRPSFACDAASPADCPSSYLDLAVADPAHFPIPAPDWAVFLALVAAAVLVRYLMTVLGARLGTEAAERVKLALRERLYRKMLALGPSYRSRVKTSDVVQSAGEGIEQIQSFFELFLPQLFYAVLAPITLFAVILPVNWPTAVTLLVCAPLIVLIVGMVAMSAARVFKRYWGRYTDLGAAFLDDVQGLETLKAFDADGAAARRMDAKAEEFRRMTMAVLQIQLRSLSAMDLVAYAGTAAGIGVALWQYAAGGATAPRMGLAAVALVVLLSADFFIPLRQLGSYFHVAMNGMTSTRRVFALLDAPEPARGTAGLPAEAAAGGIAVRFDHVGYAYRDGDGGTAVPALADASFQALPGQVTAIVGVSGSGKSTAAALLAGTLTGYTGHLGLTAGDRSVELADLDGDALAQTITLVGARSHLFPGTLRENLLMARPGATDDELWDALGRARIDDFVRAQPDGLGMRIDPDAANLSGGQRQRIAIARALLHASAVVVFDEATSSVDVDSETAILGAIRDLADSGVTVVMITHRMANAVDADAIVVFSHGCVVETGVHDRLIAADGAYARLYHAQQAIESIAHPAARGGREAVRLRLVHGQAVAAEPAGESAEAAGAAGGVTSVGGSVPSGGAAAPVPVEAADASDAAGGVTSTGESVPAGGAAAPAAAADGGEQGAFSLALVGRLLREARPLAGLMTAAAVAGTVGHLAATFLPVFGIAAAFALAGYPVWGLSTVPACALMGVCAVLRGAMRYVEQYLNHNVAFRLLAMFRSKAFAALRRLAPAKVAGKGKGDLVALVTTDVELLEIFFAHTISPVAIAAATTIVYAVALLTLSPGMAALLIVAHLVIGVAVPRFFATGVRNLGPAIRHQASELDDVMLDDMRGLDEIIRFGAGEARAAGIVRRTKALWREHARLSRVNGWFSAVGGALVALLTAAAALLAAILGIGEPRAIPALVAGFTLIASSFGPTLALSALPANLTQTFASARRLFALMDEAPAVEETGTATPVWNGMAMRHATFRYGAGAGVASAGAAGAADVAEVGTVAAEAAADDRAAAARSAGIGADVAESSAGAAGATVLTDVSFDVPARGVLGVQGPSGRGKSTMLKLLMRYWDPQEGEVSLSGVPLPQVDAHHRRRVQTMMTQETHLFDGTIRDNLLMALPDGGSGRTGSDTDRIDDQLGSSDKGVRLGGFGRSGAKDVDRSDHSFDQCDDKAPGSSWTSDVVTDADRRGQDALLREACRKASVLDLIDSLPEGLDTPVGELGDRLSEGERQRIGLARVFLRDADLILFDEPTSRLDALNEAVILGSIDALAHGESAAQNVATAYNGFAAQNGATAYNGSAAQHGSADHYESAEASGHSAGRAVVLVSHRESAMRIADQVLEV